MNDALREAYRECHAVARAAHSNFYWSFLALPAPKRAAIEAVYAFLRQTDDIADGPGAAALRQWRADLEAALAGNARTPVLLALADTVQRFQIPHRHFADLLDGTDMDQTVNRYETFPELYRYCYRVASCVGLIVLPIFGTRDESATVPAEACGIAFQLTNILRDVREDAARGRIYLPAEDRRRFGVTEEDIMQGRATPQFLELMRFEAQRARDYYRQAEPLFERIEPESRATLAVMIGVYRAVLDKLERRGFPVFAERVSLTGPEKLAVVARHWWRCRR